MEMNRETFIVWAKQNWFFVILPILVTVNYLATKIPVEIDARLNEISILFDLACLLPALYAICYRDMGRKIIVRTIGIMCLGIWLAGHLIPAEEQVVYLYFSWLRYAALAAFVLIEIKMSVFVFKLLYGREQNQAKTTRQMSEEMGVPEWAAKLMVLEAAFWKRLWKIIKNQIRRD
jgi:hypothetical protein